MAADDKQADKGEAEKQADKGKQSDKGASSGAQDVFRRVSDMGGFLIVAFVAPVPAGGGASSSNSALDELDKSATELNNELTKIIQRRKPAANARRRKQAKP